MFAAEQSLEFTFEWHVDCVDAQDRALEPLCVKLLPSMLGQRDPDGASMFASKVRFEGNTDGGKYKMSAEGPADDEWLTPASIKFVVDYVNSGNLVCPPELEGEGAQTVSSSPVAWIMGLRHRPQTANACSTSLGSRI